ncbi:MAG: GNAT family N-acetyltransferase [Actinomycetota bacterium]|nr:GNAT family N-acetyltransferase [Actinomycetota bacterium]
MVHELAAYERAHAECELTEQQLTAALFAEAPALYGHVAMDPDDRPAGFALWFLNFSTWRGVHGIYLEDLYVRPSARGTGLGHALLAELARLCRERGYARLEWWVLDWNSPAHDFYRSLEAAPMEEWTVWRLTGPALAAAATT